MIAKTRIFILFFIAGLTSVSALAFTVPELTGPVMDTAGIISAGDAEQIRQIARDFFASNKAQIQVLTLNSLEGLPIEQASIQITDKWKLGTAKQDNGVLILIAIQDRRLRIEVGQGLEGVIPDAIAKRIIADVMTPYFKEGQISHGILMGAFTVAKVIDKDFQAAGLENTQGKERGHNKRKLSNLVYLILFIVVALLSFINPRRNRFGGGGWGGGFGGGGFGGGGGGGWSGGGGGFSGGGSSGSW